MYHYIRDLKHSRYPEIKGIDISLFREQIEYMKDHFSIVTMEQVLDVNKIHYILASANIFDLVEDVKMEMDYYRRQEYDYSPTGELFNEYAIANRFDIKETIFVKRMLQAV